MGINKYLSTDETDGGPDARVEVAVTAAINLHSPEKRSAFWREKLESATAEAAASLAKPVNSPGTAGQFAEYFKSRHVEFEADETPAQPNPSPRNEQVRLLQMRATNSALSN